MNVILGLFLLFSQARQEYVRATFYTLAGTTASGERTRLGVAACSDWLPLHIRLEFSDGMVVTCLDRGLGGKYWSGWVDVWVPTYTWGVRNIREVYGDYTWVTVLDTDSAPDSGRMDNSGVSGRLGAQPLVPMAEGVR